MDESVSGLIALLFGVLRTDAGCSKTPALIAYELGWEPDAVKPLVEQARCQGHLVLDNERGYFLGVTQAAVDAWRMNRALPQLADLLEQLGAMSRTARELWRGEDDGITHKDKLG